MTVQTNTWRWLRAAPALAAVLLVLGLAGCAAPKVVGSSMTEQPFEQAAAQATDALLSQTRARAGWLAMIESKRGVVVDAMIDAGGGQQTVATQQLQSRVVERIGAANGALAIVPFQDGSLTKAAYLLTGTMTRPPAGGGQPGSAQQIDLALTDLKSGNVIAQSSAVTRGEGLDNTPLAYDRDSPVPTRDRVIEGYVRTSATKPGQAADPYYLDRIVVAPLINDAISLVNAERYQEALAQYTAAAASPAGEQLRVLSGIYLTTARLGRDADAEQAFGKVVAYGMANNQLGVKFLFNPGTTAFWPDPKVSGPYAMWLRQIARAGIAAKSCVDIVGHTSHTGSEPFNDALSLQRATIIRQRLVVEAPSLADRTRPSGRGYRENLIGSGTDNAVDALDRRVEFKIVSCGSA